MASSVLETRDSDAKYSVNLERFEDIPYLSQKAIDSNLNSPQCVQHKCKEILPSEINTTEDLIPFGINLCSAKLQEEGKRDNINLDINLVRISLIIGSTSSELIGTNSNLLQRLCGVRGS